MLPVLAFLSVFIIVPCKAEEGCSSSSSHKKANIYSQSWSQFINDINDAKQPSCSSVGEGKDLYCGYELVISQDLAPFQNGITEDMLDAARELATSPVTYKNINGTLYKSSAHCLFPARCDGVEHFLLKLSPILPDFEIVVNNNDWPFINKHFSPSPLPLMSFSKTKDYSDIYYPAWTFWAGGPAISRYPTGLGRWDLMSKLLLAEADRWPWKDKLEQAFFRGSRTSSERDSLVYLSRSMPELVDAQYTKNQAWKSIQDSLGAEPARDVSLEEHCKYKYLFNFRGVAASFRFKHLFLCGSLVLHVGSEWNEFFYPALIPWIHYVPVPAKATEQEIHDLLEFLRAHDDMAQKIAAAGHSFVKSHLKMADIYAYWKSLLASYTKLLLFQPQLNSQRMSMTAVKRTKNH